MKTLYFDLFAGCSGDMILGALIDLGADFERIREELAALPLAGYRLECRGVVKSGIRATKLDVHLDEEESDTVRPGQGESPARGHHHHHHPHPEPGADGHPLHPPAGTETAEHHHHPHTAGAGEHRHPGSQDSSPGHAGGGHHHPHRRFREIRQLLQDSALPPSAKELALEIFRHLAEAEGKIHGRPADEVAFHEVGAIDSIIDITGIALALRQLQFEEYACSVAHVGSGSIRCAHGLLPVPAPATVELLTGFPAAPGPFPGELLTPTGAAVLRTLVRQPGRMPEGKLTGTGYGAGTRDVPGGANVLRLLAFETVAAGGTDGEVVVLECNLDDMNPELLGDLSVKLLEEGALEVFQTPVHMKKFRPGTLLTVIARPAAAEPLAGRLLTSTTTFGVRSHRCQRWELARRHLLLPTRFGQLPVKTGSREGKLLKATPEYEACRMAAAAGDVSLAAVYREVEQTVTRRWADLEAALREDRDALD